MKPEDLVPSRSTCIALKEKGFPQDTFLAWDTWKRLNEGGWLVRARNGFEAFDEYLAAPTLGEILEQLPQKVVVTKNTQPYIEGSPDYNAWAGTAEREWADNPAEAAALLWERVNPWIS